MLADLVDRFLKDKEHMPAEKKRQEAVWNILGRETFYWVIGGV